MELTVHRRLLEANRTIGRLFVDGDYFCDTLEDADRGLTQTTSADEIGRRKIAHETAVPTGVYTVIAARSPAKKRILPRLLNVPGFSGVLIHRGNTAHDTSGCILVGTYATHGRLVDSTRCEKRLVEILCKAQEREEEIQIIITNDQPAEPEKPLTE